MVVELVDDDDELDDAERLGELRVLARLPALLKARLVLALAAADDEHGDVGLRRAHDHVGHVVFVAFWFWSCFVGCVWRWGVVLLWWR